MVRKGAASVPALASLPYGATNQARDRRTRSSSESPVGAGAASLVASSLVNFLVGRRADHVARRDERPSPFAEVQRWGISRSLLTNAARAQDEPGAADDR